MEKISIFSLYHRGQDCVAIRSLPSSRINRIIRQLDGVKWSRTNRCWYIPRPLFDEAKFSQELQSASIGMEKLAEAAESVAVNQQKRTHRSVQPDRQTSVISIDPVNLSVIRRVTEHLQLKSYSASTIRTYVNELKQFLSLLGSRPAESLTTDQLKRYLVYCSEVLGLTENTLHSRINALKFFYEQVLGREKFFWDIPRPKKPIQLPNVLGERELQRMFSSVRNLKHKAILFTAYSAGLRVSEVVRLKLKDIDSDRMQIFIERSKGKKDRYVGLSVLLLDVLREYIRRCYPRPRVYLFEGMRPGEPYSSRSAQLIFQRASQMAGIGKEVSFHALRHSFATHLLEKGVDIKYIKDLLGHFNIKTTERYLHVRRDHLVNIVNPLDELFRGKPWE